jgi:hypothetical protein
MKITVLGVVAIVAAIVVLRLIARRSASSASVIPVPRHSV